MVIPVDEKEKTMSKPRQKKKTIGMNKDELEQFRLTLQENNPEALTMDGFDDAIIGLARRCGQPDLVAYSYKMMIDVMMTRDKCTFEEAQEYIEFNCVGAWMGLMTPIIVEDL